MKLRYNYIIHGNTTCLVVQTASVYVARSRCGNGGLLIQYVANVQVIGELYDYIINHRVCFALRPLFKRRSC